MQISESELDQLGLPSDSAPIGVLPRVLKALVERRYEVKKLLKNERKPELRQEYDIRQQV